MKYITATEANQNMSRVLRDVAAGTTYTVTSRGKPVAEIKPADDRGKKQDLKGLAERMAKRKLVVIGPWSRDEIYDRGR